MKLFVTGHRPDKLGGYDENPFALRVQRAMRDKILELAPEALIVGMALGVDQWAAEIGLAFSIPFHAYLPFRGQELRWSLDAQWRYRYLLERAAKVVVCSLGGFAPEKMQLRNARMVEAGDEGLCVHDGSAGGTANCRAYAESRKKKLHVINPRAFAP